MSFYIPFIYKLYGKANGKPILVFINSNSAKLYIEKPMSICTCVCSPMFMLIDNCLDTIIGKLVAKILNVDTRNITLYDDSFYRYCTLTLIA